MKSARQSPQASPIYKRLSNTTWKNSSLKPKHYLNYRLDRCAYLQSMRHNVNYYLNIEKLLADIEVNATGIVCMSNKSEIIENNETLKNFRFAIKIAKNSLGDSAKEIHILTEMLEFVKKGYHNLPITYSTFQLKKKDIVEAIPDAIPDVKTKIKDFLNDTNFYNIYTSELANGDLKAFFKLYDTTDTVTDEILLNAVGQMFMAIATLHDIGIRHNDTHFGNFLYINIKPGGYIKYVINGQSYYIKNLGYLWVIWDFGISTQLNGEFDYFNDYELLSLYLRKDEDKYNMHFTAKNGKMVRRHGNLRLKHKNIPLSIQNITNFIYELSYNEPKNPAVSIPYFNSLLSDKKQFIALSMHKYNFVDHKNEKLLETNFLTEHIIPLLPSVFETHVDISHDDILFQINLTLDNIKLIRKHDGTVRPPLDYEKTIEYYKGSKIILPKRFNT